MPSLTTCATTAARRAWPEHRARQRSARQRAAIVVVPLEEGLGDRNEVAVAMAVERRLVEHAAAEGDLVVGEPQPPVTELLPQHLDFLLEVVDHLKLARVHRKRCANRTWRPLAELPRLVGCESTTQTSSEQNWCGWSWTKPCRCGERQHGWMSQTRRHTTGSSGPQPRATAPSGDLSLTRFRGHSVYAAIRC